MLKSTRRLFRSQVIWGITLVLLAPAFAQAQQTGLFPLAPIKRQRVPCPNEDPVYRKYRQDFYGYYPTCWRRFPPGWGCPSPEAPNPKKSFAEIKESPPLDDDLLKDESDRGRDRDPAQARDRQPDNSKLPDVPPGTRPSPFDVPQIKPDASPLDPPAVDDLPPPAGRPTTPNGASGALRRPRSPVAENAARDLQFQPSETRIQNSDSDPILALPDPPAALTTPLSPSGPIEAIGPTSDLGPEGPGTAMPPQAPQRRSLIGGLFNKMGFKRR